MTAVTIVVPCFNEAERLPSQEFLDFASDSSSPRFLFVDDGSSDGTAAILEGLHSRNPEKFEVLSLAQNSGKGEAVRQGMLLACDESRGLPVDYVGFWDADLATPLTAIAQFCQIFDQRPEIQTVFGSRVNLLGRSVHRNLIRHYVGRIFATAAAAVLRLPLYDSQCGAKLFRVTDELRQILGRPFLSKWIFDVEIVARYILQRRGTENAPAPKIIYEFPLDEWYDISGSKLRAIDFFIVASDLCRIQFHYFMK